MDLFDTHIHLQDFKEADFISLLKKGDVSACICISCTEKDWPKVANICETYSNIVPAFGFHPWYAHLKEEEFEQKLEQYLQKYPKALVGECGFDSLKNKNFDVQKDVFLAQINLAKKYNRAILVHAVKADVWLKEFWNGLPSKTVFHSFNAHLEQLKPIIKHGFYVALNIKILKNKHFEEIVRKIPINKLLIETDAPYQSNISDLKVLLQRIACILNVDVEDLAAKLYANTMEIVKND